MDVSSSDEFTEERVYTTGPEASDLMLEIRELPVDGGLRKEIFTDSRGIASGCGYICNVFEEGKAEIMNAMQPRSSVRSTGKAQDG